MKRTALTILASFILVAAASQSTYRSPLPAGPSKGANITGVVESEGKPVQGVVVSDGYETTVTDARGRYRLNSEKRNGQVFISVPSGYEAWCDDVVPQFWAKLTAPVSEPERHDFRLVPSDNSKHVLIAITDPHMCNIRDDVAQFTNGCLPRIREEVEKYRAEGIPVYTMCLGDSSWDRLWYELCFEIGDFRSLLNDVGYPTPLYNVMGNHDNDGSVQAGEDTDFEAAKPYMEAFGPRYYSFNAGGIHYVVLDNVVYLNEGKSTRNDLNIAGSCNYDKYFTREQLDWLEKDLAYVTDKNTPVIIGIHCPLYRYKGVTTEASANIEEENIRELLDILEDFTEVRFLTGHTHANRICRVPGTRNNVTDHNIPATCGAWWNTGATGGLNIGPDGTPAGFGVFVADGQDLSWYFTSYDDGPQQQFRTFDINGVRDFYRKSGELKAFLMNYPKWYDFRAAPDNQVYISVWTWDPEWTVTVTENGKQLPVTAKMLENPQYNVSYMLQQTVWTDTFSPSYDKPRTMPIYLVEASAPDTTLEITVTDTQGNVYSQTMERPKEFHKRMR